MKNKYIDIGKKIVPTGLCVYKYDYFCNKVHNILNDKLHFECIRGGFDKGHAAGGGFEHTLSDSCGNVIASFKGWDMSSENRLIYKGKTYNYFSEKVFENIKNISDLEKEIDNYLDVPQLTNCLWEKTGERTGLDYPTRNIVAEASDGFYYQVDCTPGKGKCGGIYNLNYINKGKFVFKLIEETFSGKIKDFSGNKVTYRRKLELIKVKGKEDEDKKSKRKLIKSIPDSESIFLEKKRLRNFVLEKNKDKREAISFYEDSKKIIIGTGFDWNKIPRGFSATGLRAFADIIELNIDENKALKSVKYGAWSHVNNIFNMGELDELINKYNLYPLQEALEFYGNFYKNKFLNEKCEITREWNFGINFKNTIGEILNDK